MSERIKGLVPFVDEGSLVLILGSFPSVKSRAVEFYYGNPQNRFWGILAEYFAVDLPKTQEDKKLLLKNNKLALWDIVVECSIKGSSDNTITNYLVADLKKLLQNSKISSIILNGSKAKTIFERHFEELIPLSIALPSTSPANTKFDKEAWFDGLSRAFEKARGIER